MIFAKRIKELRIQHGLTQQQMSERLIMDQSTYSRYENGVTKATTDVIIRIAEEFNIPIDQLLKAGDPASKNKNRKTNATE